MQRNVITTAKRQLLDLTANYTLSSVISGNAATASPQGRGPRWIGVHGSNGSNRGVREDKTEKSWHQSAHVSTQCPVSGMCHDAYALSPLPSQGPHGDQIPK